MKLAAPRGMYALRRRAADAAAAAVALQGVRPPATRDAIRRWISLAHADYSARLAGGAQIPWIAPVALPLHNRQAYPYDHLLISAAMAHYELARHDLCGDRVLAALQGSHSTLWPLTDGLVSLSRGMGLNRATYLKRLDGDREAWCEWFLDVAAEEVAFITGLLDLDGMKRRITTLVTSLQRDSVICRKAILPLHYLFAAGSMTQPEFIQATGPDKAAGRRLLEGVVDAGLVTRDDALVRFNIPRDAVDIMLPGLWPEVRQ